MVGLPKKYAKMGFKKGWRDYKATRKSTRKSTRKTRSVKVMARRRKGGFRRYIKRSYRKAKSGFSFGTIAKTLIGVAIVAVYEVFVSPMIPLDAMMKNILEFGIGVFLTMQGNPTLKSAGIALMVVNAYSLIVPYVSGMAGSSGVGTSDAGY